MSLFSGLRPAMDKDAVVAALGPMKGQFTDRFGDVWYEWRRPSGSLQLGCRSDKSGFMWLTKPCAWSLYAIPDAASIDKLFHSEIATLVRNADNIKPGAESFELHVHAVYPDGARDFVSYTVRTYSLRGLHWGRS
jgi:hypothetical protein